MARVTKQADVRRDELLDVAFQLCVTEGFDATSVEHITTTAGIAKGTFYHYFESKDDLLAQMVAKFGDELLGHMEARMAAADGDALVRLRTLMQASSDWKLAQLDTSLAIIPVLYREENYTLRHRLFSEWLERTRPLLLEILTQGARDGSFDIADPVSMTNVVLALWFDYAGRLWESAMGAPDPVETMLEGAEAMLVAQERILGVAPGSTHVVMDEARIAATRGAVNGFIASTAGSNDRRASK
jgi:AcrR family transcriptional regulator